MTKTKTGKNIVLAQAIFDKTQKITYGDLKTSKQLIAKLFAEIKSFLVEIESLVAQKNMLELAKVFHKTAGSAGYFGSMDLYKIALELEGLAKQNHWQNLEAGLPIFQDKIADFLNSESHINLLLKNKKSI